MIVGSIICREGFYHQCSRDICVGCVSKLCRLSGKEERNRDGHTHARAGVVGWKAIKPVLNENTQAKISINSVRYIPKQVVEHYLEAGHACPAHCQLIRDSRACVHVRACLPTRMYTCLHL